MPVVRSLIVLWMVAGLSGCAVVAVVDTAASAVVGVGGLVVDAAVGTVRIGGKVVGAGADMVLGGGGDEVEVDSVE
jgi:hypothetical protein